MTLLEIGRRGTARAIAGAVVLGGAALAGCQADYAADVRNMTPQPLYAQIIARYPDTTTVLASQRLGPGDRGAVGPVRTDVGRAVLIVDTLPNPEAPAEVVLRPGTAFVNVRQLGEGTAGPLQLEEITR